MTRTGWLPAGTRLTRASQNHEGGCHVERRRAVLDVEVLEDEAVTGTYKIGGGVCEPVRDRRVGVNDDGRRRSNGLRAPVAPPVLRHVEPLFILAEAEPFG